MPTRQNRLPGVKWSEYSTKGPRIARSRTEQLGQDQPTNGEQAAARPGPIAGPGPAAEGEPGIHFNISGSGRYYNPSNISGHQFNGPAIKQSLQHAVREHTKAQYFRRAGMGAALRYTLGMEQVPSHVQDYLNARNRPRNSIGVHPGPTHSYYSGNEPDEWI